MEKELLLLLPKKGKRISSLALVELYYKDNRPYHAQQSVSKVMRDLMKKVDYNVEDFKIIRTRPGGHRFTEYAKVDR